MAGTGACPDVRHLPALRRRDDTMSMPATLYYSAEMVRNLPDDGNRYETVHGELLVTPAPRQPHQAVLLELILALGNYLKAEQIKGCSARPQISPGGRTRSSSPTFLSRTPRRCGLRTDGLTSRRCILWSRS